MSRMGSAALAVVVTASLAVLPLGCGPSVSEHEDEQAARTIALAPDGLAIDRIVYQDGFASVATPAFSTTAPNELLLAFVASSGPITRAQAVAVSGAGLTWTLVHRVNSQAGTAEIWKATAPAPLTDARVWSWQAVWGYYQSLTVVALTGASGTGRVAGASAPSGAPSVTVTSSVSDAWIFAVGNDRDGAIPRTLGAGQVMVHEWTQPRVSDDFWVQRLATPTAAPGTAVLMNATAPTTNRWNLAAVEVVPAAPTPPAPTTPAPTFAPAPGTYQAAQAVTISGSAPDVTIHYTTDGSVPSSASPIYRTPITVDVTTTVRAFATAPGLIPSAVVAGRYVIEQQGITISPATAAAPPRGTVSFAASGGSGVGFAWALAVDGSGASVNAATGVYTAGPTGGVTDVVRVTDSVGNSATASVAVGAGVSVSPPSASTSPGGRVAFSASGGSGAGFAWTLAVDRSGASVNAATGAYTAGPTGGVTDVVRVVDSLGNTATASVFVAAFEGVAIDTVVFRDGSGTVTSPAFRTTAANALLLAFVGSDGPVAGAQTVTVSGAGLTWSLVRRANAQAGTSEIWKATAAAPLSDVTVRSGQAFSGYDQSLTVVALVGASGTGNVAGASAPVGAPSVTLTSSAAGASVFAVGHDWDRAIPRTLGAGQVMVHEWTDTRVGDDFWVQRLATPTAAPGMAVLMNATAPTTDRWNLVAVEVVPAQAYTVSGTIGPATSGSGATVTLSGAVNATTTAGPTGAFSFPGLGSGRYTVTPAKSGYAFTPSSRPVIVEGVDVSGVDFTASGAPLTHTISGTVSPNGSGTTVTLGGAASRATTVDASGGYAFTGVANGEYTVTPSKTGYAFEPASRTVTVSGADVGGVSFTASPFAANLTVDGSREFQVVDGIGVNVNANSWNRGQVAAALDLLVDQGGFSIFRVIRDPMDWVGAESLIPALHRLDAATLQQVYEAPRTQDLWSTIGYLNARGIRGDRIVLALQGWTPEWIGGSGEYGTVSSVTPGKEPSLATMIASLVYYGRAVKGLDFTLLSPLNEPDWNGLEGPQVSDSQYTAILGALVDELDAMGLADVRLVGPDTVGSPSYAPTMMGDAKVASRTEHLAFHVYGATAYPGTAYPGKDYWLTEAGDWCSTCDANGAPDEGEWSFASDTADIVLGDLANGVAAALLWEGYDGYYYHHDAASSWGLLAYDGTTYTPRKRFYVNAQLSAFIRPGSTLVAMNDTVAGLGRVLAFVDAAAGKLAIVGHVTSSSPVTIRGRLTNVPFAVTTLRSYRTSLTVDLERQPDVSVVGQTFSVTIPGNTFFSLAN